MIKVGIVGCGGIGRTHARAFSAIPDVKVSAFVDCVKKSAESAASEYGGTAYTGLSEVEEKLDLVSVATPPNAHYKAVLELLAKKIPAFCEKPLTMSCDEARQIVAASAKTGVPVGVGFKMRYEPVFEKAREYIGEIGKLYAVSAVKNQPYNTRAGYDWIPDVGCMYELSVHDYDLVNWIGGIKPVAVYADLDYSMQWKRENRAFLTVDYTNGVKGQLTSIYSPDTKFTGRDLSITFVGEYGYLRIERPDRIILHARDYKVIDVEPIEGLKVFSLQLRKFISSLEQGEKYQPDAETASITTFMVEAAYESFKQSKKVDLLIL